ncbi:unnamed protein product [Parascedosporium putredinis]|uniref:tRNA-splicing endonuclease subunit Sen2 n=1 Tax=Parascedosporium putredinis TaxID=1442378 RepID=A0A9P1MBJ4_9PEZI|nr:unnamed protein product [Parascedosporium putredinis]CAI7994920.1 unnamed protein product [Parascedosporium putredinis]
MATTQPSISPGLLNAGPVINTSAVPAAPLAQTKRTKADLHQLHALPAGAVLVKDAVSIRALWEQGFYGKGHLSRSEPEWFRQEQVKRGLLQAHVSHLNTAKRREERRTKKWERAKSEIDALRQLQSKEAEIQRAKEATEAIVDPISTLPPLGPWSSSPFQTPCHHPKNRRRQARANRTDISTANPSATGALNLRLSMEMDTPPHPDYLPPKESPLQELDKDESALESQQQQVAAVLGDLVDKEHLQLTREEAFFLSFGLGALQVVDGESKEPVAPRDLLELFRRYSYIPPQQGPPSEVLRPDDRFLLDYVIYHHFRSLGWVPRGGIKFGVDWLLYFKGPAFDHAQYGIIIMPSYSHPYWKERGQHSPSKDWAWFHRVSRTLANVLKTIVLAYVDIPPPPVFEEALDKGITDVMQLYTVREIIAKRFNPNRERKS